VHRPHPVRRWARSATARRASELAPLAITLALGLLAARAVAPASAQAADLFPVDDWLGEGIKKAGDVVLGPLKLGAEQIAQLLATIVGALADLLVPKSLVRAGLGGIKWLVQLPPVGVDATAQAGIPAVRMPHLAQLRDTMTWIGVTVLPLGLVVTGGRAYLAPTADGDSPAEVLSRVITAGVGLLIYDWAWGVVTELSRLLTSGLLGLPWVADGVERMLETLVIGGATGSAVAAEFVVPLMVLIAGTVLLGLLLVRIGLEVATALLYVLGGLVLGLSVTGFGRRLWSAWLIAAGAILLLPLLWSAVFVTGAALMLDAGDTGGHGGFGSFVAQLYNVAAALAVFWIAIKLALGVFRHASGAITGITATPAASAGGGARGPAGLPALAQNATPAGLAGFSRNLRGRLSAAATYPARHPIRTAHATSYPLRRPVQATREAASGLADALNATAGKATRTGQRAGDWYQAERGGGRFSAQAANRRANASKNGAAAAGNGQKPAATAGRAGRSSRSSPATGNTTRASARAPASRTEVAPRSASPPPRSATGLPRASQDDREAPKASERDAAPHGAPTHPPRAPARPLMSGTRPVWWRRARRNERSDDRDGKRKS
jgi:hypothetical protein